MDCCNKKWWASVQFSLRKIRESLSALTGRVVELEENGGGESGGRFGLEDNLSSEDREFTSMGGYYFEENYEDGGETLYIEKYPGGFEIEVGNTNLPSNSQLRVRDDSFRGRVYNADGNYGEVAVRSSGSDENTRDIELRGLPHVRLIDGSSGDPYGTDSEQTTSTLTNSHLLAMDADGNIKTFTGSLSGFSSQQPVDIHTGSSRVLGESDMDVFLVMSNGDNLAHTILIPTMTVPLGAEINGFVMGNSVQITIAGGVTLYSKDNLRGIYVNTAFKIKNIGTNQWILIGDLIA